MSVSAPSEGGSPDQASAPDPASYPAWVAPPEPPGFDWTQSDYTRAVLASKGCLSIMDGSYLLNNAKLNDHLANIVLDPGRLITDQNISQISLLGLDWSDILGVVWGRPPSDASSHPTETTHLTKIAWAKLTHKGDVVKSHRLPHGVIMAESGVDLSRTVIKDDGTSVPMAVKLRFATTLSEHQLNYVINPAMARSMESLKKSLALVVEGMEQYPADKALMAGTVQAMVTQVSGMAAPVLQRAGLVLNPATVVPVAEVNGSKKPKAAITE
jgi:hypothetical protein